MNITKRLYTYPVLSEEKDDYNTSVFGVDLKHTMNGVNYLRLDFLVSLDNEELKNLIINGFAEYVIHIECSNTAYRTTLNFITEQNSLEIPVGRIYGKLEMIALIVLKKNVSQLVNSDWNEDYKGVTFDLVKGTILGFKNLPILDVVKNYEEFASTSSIFRVYGGGNNLGNLVPVHYTTNIEKGDKFPHWDANGKDFKAVKKNKSNPEKGYNILCERIWAVEFENI